MEFHQTLRGTKEDCKFVFNNFNVRHMTYDEDTNTCDFLFRVREDFKINKRVKTIKTMVEKLWLFDEYLQDNEEVILTFLNK